MSLTSFSRRSARARTVRVRIVVVIFAVVSAHVALSSAGDMNNFTFGGADFGYYETIAGALRCVDVVQYL